MSSSSSRSLRKVGARSADLTDTLAQQLATLREELADLSDAVADYGGHAFHDVQHSAHKLAKEVRHQGRIVAREVGHQAEYAGRVVRDNPVPVLVALGTLALLSTLLVARRD